MKYGSTNLYAFAVHPGSTPSRNGDVVSNERSVDVGYAHGNDVSNFTHLWQQNTRDENSVVCWQYDSGGISPEIWVIRDSSDNVKYVWEAESKFHPNRDSAQPFVDINARRQSLIPSGGSIVQVIYPSQTVIDSIETSVGSASLPDWIDDTPYSNASTTASLLEMLFRAAQVEAGLTVRADITTALNYYASAQVLETYIHIWLRQASKIIYDYNAESLVELMQTLTTVDSDGVISV